MKPSVLRVLRGERWQARDIVGSKCTYLRMLTNAVAGGVLGAAYLAVLVLQLNPQVPAGITAVRWFGTLIMFYGLYLSVAIMRCCHPQLLASAAVARMAERSVARVVGTGEARRRQ
jgi:hypothetical protein